MQNELLDHEHSHETIVIRQYFSIHEAELAAAMLRSAGVDCFLANTQSINAMGMEFSPVRLHVKNTQFGEAEEVLAEMSITQTDPKEASNLNKYLWFGLFALLIILVILAIFKK